MKFGRQRTMTEDAYTISLPCEPGSSGELKIGNFSRVSDYPLYTSPGLFCRFSAESNSNACSNVTCRHLLQKVSRVARKHVFRVSDRVRQKPGCTATDDGYLEA